MLEGGSDTSQGREDAIKALAGEHWATLHALGTWAWKRLAAFEADFHRLCTALLTPVKQELCDQERLRPNSVLTVHRVDITTGTC